MRIAVNTIRQSLSMVSESGITLDSEEEEFEDYYQFTIRIPKRNSTYSIEEKLNNCLVSLFLCLLKIL